MDYSRWRTHYSFILFIEAKSSLEKLPTQTVCCRRRNRQFHQNGIHPFYFFTSFSSLILKEKDLRDHLSRLRIDALIRVVELTKQDISAYAHQVYSI